MSYLWPGVAVEFTFKPTHARSHWGKGNHVHLRFLLDD